jgi:acyl-coenzyme A thioesterase PaaI-like protein
MSDVRNPPIAEVVNSALEQTIPVAHRMGVHAEEVRRGYAAATVPVEGNGNHFGVMYAGVLFTVGEILGGAIAVASFDTTRFYPLVKDLRIVFRKPATTAVRAQATLDDAEIDRIAAEAAANGKADFTLRAVLSDADGVVDRPPRWPAVTPARPPVSGEPGRGRSWIQCPAEPVGVGGTMRQGPQFSVLKPASVGFTMTRIGPSLV